ncbi:DNA packaging protein [Lacticaseibacillus manihotivorans DSM 13343 = JCM 12514]|uniref:DNA packaging protein n=2 Tax=Lacticaseibacillus manihotivorans TaxID=88233 RepID=A0A0R1QL48_9LACO|nr:phage head-tail connector protein [Lacticaseibacillus manihotivorans]KRL45118.1 DNA packaging protein [Lacticaseibacillus manihotivorans DSM 13343 = JCM 12514]
MEILDGVKLRIGLTDTMQDNLLNELIEDATARVLAYINQDGVINRTVPSAVTWVIKDVVVKMYNRIGDEGKAASGEGNVSNTWETIDLSKYADGLDVYRDSSQSRRPGMRFV